MSADLTRFEAAHYVLHHYGEPGQWFPTVAEAVTLYKADGAAVLTQIASAPS